MGKGNRRNALSLALTISLLSVAGCQSREERIDNAAEKASQEVSNARIEAQKKIDAAKAADAKTQEDAAQDIAKAQAAFDKEKNNANEKALDANDKLIQEQDEALAKEKAAEADAQKNVADAH